MLASHLSGGVVIGRSLLLAMPSQNCNTPSPAQGDKPFEPKPLKLSPIKSQIACLGALPPHNDLTSRKLNSCCRTFTLLHLDSLSRSDLHATISSRAIAFTRDALTAKPLLWLEVCSIVHYAMTVQAAHLSARRRLTVAFSAGVLGRNRHNSHSC